MGYMARHLGYSPRHRVQRASTPRHRRNLVLADGTVIRRAGSRWRRLTSDQVEANVDRLCMGMTVGLIELRDESRRVLTPSELRSLFGEGTASTEESPPASEEEPIPDPDEDLDDLLDLLRRELEERALSLGVENPESFPNKTELARAILAIEEEE